MVWLAFRGEDWSAFGAKLDAVDMNCLIAYLLIFSAAHLLRIIRWGVLVRALGPVPWSKVLRRGRGGLYVHHDISAAPWGVCSTLPYTECWWGNSSLVHWPQSWSSASSMELSSSGCFLCSFRFCQNPAIPRLEWLRWGPTSLGSFLCQPSSCCPWLTARGIGR